jgi:flagellar motor switch protein FliM
MEEELKPQNLESKQPPAAWNPVATNGQDRVIGDCDFRQSGQLSAEQVRQLAALHQTFATGLASSLGAYLRVGIEAKLLGVEQIPYREFVGRLPEQPYVASISMMPAEESAAVQLDLRLLLPVIDLLLGGSGRDKADADARELTEIDEQVLETLLALICRELQAAWQPLLQVQFQPERRLKPPQLLKLMEAEDRTLYLNFEVVLNDIRGMLAVIFSYTTASQILRQLGQQGTSVRRTVPKSENNHLRERLLDCKFTAELRIPRVALRIRDIVDLQPGQILPLRHPINDALSFSINGLALFGGLPVSCGTSRGALLQEKAVPANLRSGENS